MEALRVEGLSKNFGGVQVLRDVYLNAEAGERVAIIGPNGAGKTTLLKLLAGELPATAGRVYVFGQEITHMAMHRRFHLGLSRSFQLTTLFFNLTVLSNVLLALHDTKPSLLQMFRRVAYGGLQAKAERLLRSVDLWEKRDDLVEALSYGEQRKMEVAVCLASEPKLLLLDEPSTGLTADETVSLINMINALARDTTVLLVAHDMDIVFGLADRIMVLYYGKIIAQGTPEEIQNDPRVKEIYLGPEERAVSA